MQVKHFFKSLKAEKIVPAVVSFFIPGLGQIAKGQVAKAFMIWILGSLISFYTWGELTFLIPVLFWIWNIYDAYSD